MDHLLTEARNPASSNLDELTALELVRLMNAEDGLVAAAVGVQAEAIARAIDIIAHRLRTGGRLVYAGAGTSGRLGVLDATECPPTFNSPLGQVVGIIAGGPRAVTQAVEGAEDHPEYGEQDLVALQFGSSDVLVGIATSGRTPYVLGAADYARRLGAPTIGLACNPDSELESRVDVPITIAVGPEVLSGSTRLKAGTATKLVLNMLTTGAMVRLGKTYGNLMVDLRATNEKLKARTNRIVRHLTGFSVEEADNLLQRCGGELKTALVSHLAGIDPGAAQQRLQATNGQVRRALGECGGAAPSSIPAPDLFLGIDGGGSNTVALLGRRQSGSTADARTWELLGKGQAGPSNLRAVGAPSAIAALEQAVQGAFAAAIMPRTMVAAACLGLAGADRAEEKELLLAWAKRRQLADRVEVTSDASLLLAAGTPAGWGLAVVAGTGSMVFGKAQDGRFARAGGWGYLLGDEGSGYAIGLGALQAVLRAGDGHDGPTRLSERILGKLGLQLPQDLVAAVYGGTLTRAAIAALAPVVMETADTGDDAATALVHREAESLAETAAAAASRLFDSEAAFPLALAGGMLVSQPSYRQQFLDALARRSVRADTVTMVEVPAEGAVRLALELARDAR